MSESVEEVFCQVCGLDRDGLAYLVDHGKYERIHHRFWLDPAEVIEDFTNQNYTLEQRPSDVTKPGQFCIDNEWITVCLKPAVYPHHIVGITEKGEVFSLSICGRSGRSGITIEAARKLCADLRDDKTIALADALIFDNGNDVIARLFSGALIHHEKNDRQARLTAALHFGLALSADRNVMCGLEMGMRAVEVHAGVATAQARPQRGG
jgi:hypothetical protein